MLQVPAHSQRAKALGLAERASSSNATAARAPTLHNVAICSSAAALRSTSTMEVRGLVLHYFCRVLSLSALTASGRWQERQCSLAFLRGIACIWFPNFNGLLHACEHLAQQIRAVQGAQWCSERSAAAGCMCQNWNA